MGVRRLVESQMRPAKRTRVSIPKFAFLLNVPACSSSTPKENSVDQPGVCRFYFCCRHARYVFVVVSGLLAFLS